LALRQDAERNGWTKFVSMQPQYNLLYREEEREMLPLCEDQGFGVIPWSRMVRGRLTRDWSEISKRTENDAFALGMYQRAAELDQEVVKVVARIAGGTACRVRMSLEKRAQEAYSEYHRQKASASRGRGFRLPL
jgi:aryl-alcohol dehydrogenase-like predicted oxidoreductase